MSISREVRFDETRKQLRRAFHTTESRRKAPFQTASAEEWQTYFFSEGDWVTNTKYYDEKLAAWTKPEKFLSEEYPRADHYLSPAAYEEPIPYTVPMAEISFCVRSVTLIEENEAKINEALNLLDEVQIYNSLTEHRLWNTSLVETIPSLQYRGHKSLLELNYFKKLAVEHMQNRYHYLKTIPKEAALTRYELENGTPEDNQRKQNLLDKMHPTCFDWRYLWSAPLQIHEELTDRKVQTPEKSIDVREWWSTATAEAGKTLVKRPIFNGRF